MADTINSNENTNSSQVKDLIIIGAGPSGLTAAIYAARAELKPLVIEGYKAGGQLMLTTEVENFPGFEQGVNGPDLITTMRKQAQRFNTEFLTEDVTEVDFKNSPFTIKTGSQTFQAKAVIISTGADARWLGLDSEKALMGKGVTSCATCDGAFYKGEEVVVIGGGDSAMEEATFLTKFASKVTVIHRRDTLKASKAMQKRAMDNPKINFIYDSEVLEVMDVNEKKVTGAKIKNTKTGEETIVPCTGFFLAIGHVPNTKLFSDTKIELDEHKYIKTIPGSTKTTISGVFACGDVQDTKYRQAITAAGTGCMAALEAEHYIASLNDKE
ncbi:thioredoxin-disulfide reductase [archaeon]|jgi:thioredoxin reductase (NADPH)|nr:thioredoxin-disulfide reductase [archaeon]MBT6697936.1 thioredoxin-disulfide reductase [archaeon]